MKRLCALLSLVAALATVAVAAAPAGASNPDISRGSGKLILPTVFGPLPAHLIANAKGDPAVFPGTDTNVRGHFRTTLDATSIGLGPHEVIAGIVTCLNVTDNGLGSVRAVLGGMITSSTQPLIIPPGTGTIEMNVDNGQGANDPPDTVEATATLGPPPQVCPPSFTGLFGQAPIDQGNRENQEGTL
jgi:hypothetical protein